MITHNYSVQRGSTTPKILPALPVHPFFPPTPATTDLLLEFCLLPNVMELEPWHSTIFLPFFPT